MNIFLEYQKKIEKILYDLDKEKIVKVPQNLKGLTIEVPPNKISDISCNAALILSKINQKEPMEIANLLKTHLEKNFKEFNNVEIAAPGFLNINFSSNFWKIFIKKIILNKKNYGFNKTKNKKKFNVEFVSANPTGPLHVGHCRGAILGDVISNLLKFNGHKVIKEYYVNDYGNQINNFVKSVYYRIVEILYKKKFPSNEDLYPGSYIIDIANKILKKNKKLDYSKIDPIYNKLKNECIKYSLNLIKNDLSMLGITHDKFVNESFLIKKNKVKIAIEKLIKKKYVYEGKLNAPKGELDENWKQRSQLLFKSSFFGDDMDRALKKEDNTWTYFAGDIAYHSDKVDRKFDTLINILGADHAGYIKRISSAVKALSDDKINLICKVSQLVRLFKNGKPFKMSKRKGDYITISDVLDEVGKDAIRFIMLNRSNDAVLDFDFEKVIQKTKDNPVYYVQYAYARINSIFRLLNKKIYYKFKNEKEIIFNEHEMKIIRKISEWPKCVQLSVSKMEPHRIPFYLYELSTYFHSYWSLGKDNKSFRFLDKNRPSSISKMLLLQSLATVIENGMKLIGVSTPRKM